MKRIIHNEFINHGYYPLEETVGLDYYKHETFNDFWIACYDDFILDNQSELFERYLAKFVSDYPTIKKNTSLVIVAEEGLRSTEEIVAIENDPYLFKKYYLPFSQESVDGLCDLLNLQGGGMMSIDRLMVNPAVFAELKRENEGGVYHLLYSIAHKLPFLPVHVNHEEVLSTDFMLNLEQDKCLRWCYDLSDNDAKRKQMILDYSLGED